VRPALHLLFFLSGATALVFELLWLRGFALVLGSTLRAMACVLTAFMLGLALGGALAAHLLRKRSIAPGQAFRIYALLEIAIGVYGAVFTGALFENQETFIRFIAGAHAAGGALEIAADFSLSCLSLAIPTIAMGATLPVLSAALRDDRDTASLYAANLVGAASGSLASSFLVINLLGCIRGAYVTAAINAGICVFAWWLSRDETRMFRPTVAEEPGPATPDPSWSSEKTLLLAFFSGFVFFESELVFNRFLSLFLGNRVYVTSVTLAVVLGCLALSARLVRWSLTRASFREVCTGAYGVAAVSTLLAVALAPSALASGGRARFLFVLLLVPLPAIAAGMVFPVLLTIADSAGDATRRVRHVGRVVAVNTLGSVVGTLLTSYALIGNIGSLGTLLSGVVFMGASVWLLGSASRLFRAGGPVLVALAIGLFFVRREVPLGADPGANVVLRDEDEHCLFLVQRFEDQSLGVECTGTELVNRFGTTRTQFVQETQAHLPLMFAPKTARVLVIGSGYGITAGAFGLYTGVEHIDAVEILPLMLRHAELFASGNHGYLTNDKISVHVADGRHFLALATQPYDVVSINVTDPYLPGTASLYSDEFYALVARHLSPGGIVCQHVFGPDSATLLHGFRAHFPHLRAIPSYAGALTLMGSTEALSARRSPFDDPRGRAALRALGIENQDAIESLLARGDTAIAGLREIAPAFVHSDTFPVLEFRRTSSVDTFRSNF
jgi:predicted membrane-bound spermidine synthase